MKHFVQLLNGNHSHESDQRQLPIQRARNVVRERAGEGAARPARLHAQALVTIPEGTRQVCTLLQH